MRDLTRQHHASPLRLAGRWAGLLICLVAGIVVFSESAYAGDGFSSYEYGYEGTANQKGIQDVQIKDDFVCLPDGSSEGTLFINENCDGSGVVGVFSQVVCRVENLFGTVMGLVYCSVVKAILKPFLAILVLYVTIYGAVVILGLKRARFSTALLHVMKLALVAGFVLNSQVAIQVGYKFYISMAQSTVDIIFSGLDTAPDDPQIATLQQAGYVVQSGAGADAYGQQKLAQKSHWMMHLDGTLHKLIQFFVNMGVGFIMVLLGLLIWMPALFAVVVFVIFYIVKTLAEAIIGYLKALLGITFLFTLAPIFISFALFKQTQEYFEAWLRHLAGFTLQMLTVFTFLMFIVAIDLVGFMQQIGSLVRSYSYHLQWGIFHSAWTVMSLCRVQQDGMDADYRGGTIIYYTIGSDGKISNNKGNMYDGFPKCIENYEFDKVMSGEQQLPYIPHDQIPQITLFIQEEPEFAKTMGYNIDEDTADAGTDAIMQSLVTQENDRIVYKFTELAEAIDIISFLTIRLVALGVLLYLLCKFLKEIPPMAEKLATHQTQQTGSYEIDNPHSLSSDPRYRGVAQPHALKMHGTKFGGFGYGLLRYNEYVGRHHKNPFREGNKARRAYTADHADIGFIRRHVGGAMSGLRVSTGAFAYNRLHMAAGLAPAAVGAGRDVLYRTAMRGAMLGRDSRINSAIESTRQHGINFGTNYYHAGGASSSNMGRPVGLGRHGGRGEVPSYGGGRWGGSGRYQRGRGGPGDHNN